MVSSVGGQRVTTSLFSAFGSTEPKAARIERVMSEDERLRIATRKGADRLILELDGELDMASSDVLQAALARANGGEASTVVLDLRGVSFLDSTGLKAIFNARKAVGARGQQFAVTPGSAQVQRLLSLTRLDEHLRTIDSPDALLA